MLLHDDVFVHMTEAWAHANVCKHRLCWQSERSLPVLQLLSQLPAWPLQQTASHLLCVRTCEETQVWRWVIAQAGQALVSD